MRRNQIVMIHSRSFSLDWLRDHRWALQRKNHPERGASISDLVWGFQPIWKMGWNQHLGEYIHMINMYISTSCRSFCEKLGPHSDLEMTVGHSKRPRLIISVDASLQVIKEPPSFLLLWASIDLFANSHVSWSFDHSNPPWWKRSMFRKLSNWRAISTTVQRDMAGLVSGSCDYTKNIRISWAPTKHSKFIIVKGMVQLPKFISLIFAFHSPAFGNSALLGVLLFKVGSGLIPLEWIFLGVHDTSQQWDSVRRDRNFLMPMLVYFFLMPSASMTWNFPCSDHVFSSLKAKDDRSIQKHCQDKHVESVLQTYLFHLYIGYLALERNFPCRWNGRSAMSITCFFTSPELWKIQLLCDKESPRDLLRKSKNMS